MGKISNVFTMLQLLNNNKKYTIKELSERLEVSERMIRLYKDDLEKSGIYIDTIRGPYGGYVLNQQLNLPPRGFNKYDVKLLKSIEEILRQNNNFNMHLELLNLIDKVEGIYKGGRKNKQANSLTIGDDKEKYNTLTRAIKEMKKVLINFISIDGTSIERVIHPCDMYLYNNRWYVCAFCELRGEMRHFSLDRITDHHILEQKY
jgi:predicted DNA-binding transcriptional regulator YafY